MTSTLSTTRSLVAGAGRVVALTGAGISTDSGIPDFRGPQGRWTQDPDAEKVSVLSYYLGDEDIRRKAWRIRATSPALTAQPNPAHRALVDLERAGRLAGIVTQNTDGLHLVAGSDPAIVHEIHGTPAPRAEILFRPELVVRASTSQAPSAQRKPARASRSTRV